MSLTNIEREKVDALKRHQVILEAHKEKYRILKIAESEKESGELQVLSAEDRILVDSAKQVLQDIEDFEKREAELLAIALTELGL